MGRIDESSEAGPPGATGDQEAPGAAFEEAPEDRPLGATTPPDPGAPFKAGGPGTRFQPAVREAASPFHATSQVAVEEEEDEGPQSFLPRPPRMLVEMGLSKAFLTDLVLKIMHYSGTPTTAQLMRRVGVGSTIMQQLLTTLGEERLVEVMSQSDLYTGNYRYRLSDRGRARVAEALERSRYAGPAPVTAEQYSETIRRLHAQPQDQGRSQIKAILDELVLPQDVSDAVARALFSGKTGMFYGPSGNGKTVILERFARNLSGFFLVPYAIYAYGQVIRVFDQSVHQPLEQEDEGSELKDDAKFDQRWVMIKRPAIVVGAEMGPESLDLAYDPQARFSQAPPHIKAQGGVMVVDDFGRQSVSPRDLLTRWLIPLQRGWDTLTLMTGEKLAVPFKVHLLFGTNQPIKQLADDALLRRILYKVPIPNPGPEDFSDILERACREKRVLVTDGTLEYVVQKLYSNPDLRPRGSYARDLLDILIESAAYDGIEPVLDRKAFDHVFKLFLVNETENGDYDLSP
jgi:hypothetical protein